MFLFTLLAIISLILVGVVVLTISAFGATAAVVFGDLIVFGVIIAIIIRLTKKRKK